MGEFGYSSQFPRVLRRFALFAIAFSIVSITTGIFVNYSYGSQNVRLNIPVGVAYGSDLDKVSEALLEAAGSVEDVLNIPEPQVHFDGFGDSSLNFEIRVWINEPRKHTQIRSSVNFAIDRALRKHSIEIPFPQRDLHLRTGFGIARDLATPDD